MSAVLKHFHGPTRPRHGRYGSPIYKVWRQMLRRCYDVKFISYSRYGAIGVTVCERWKKFENFLGDMGEKPDGKQIDRIKNELGYEPGNCRWATLIEQANNKRSNHLVTWNGKTQSLAVWERELGLPEKALYERLARYKWPLEKAMTTPQNPIRLKAWKTRKEKNHGVLGTCAR